MKVVEEFDTIQGEGQYLGVPSRFIRTTGCNLRCAWKNPDGSITKCDTPYTSWDPERGEEYDCHNTVYTTPEHIHHIVITGGEPLLQPDTVEVANELTKFGYQVTIETNGTFFKAGLNKKILLSISPKLRSSHAQEEGSVEQRIHLNGNDWYGTVRQYVKNDFRVQLKFVVNSEWDLDEIDEAVRRLGADAEMVWLMPQGITTEQFRERSQMIFQHCIVKGYNYSPRVHIDVYGNKRGI